MQSCLWFLFLSAIFSFDKFKHPHTSEQGFEMEANSLCVRNELFYIFQEKMFLSLIGVPASRCL